MITNGIILNFFKGRRISNSPAIGSFLEREPTDILDIKITHTTRDVVDVILKYGESSGDLSIRNFIRSSDLIRDFSSKIKSNVVTDAFVDLLQDDELVCSYSHGNELKTVTALFRGRAFIVKSKTYSKLPIIDQDEAVNFIPKCLIKYNEENRVLFVISAELDSFSRHIAIKFTSIETCKEDYTSRQEQLDAKLQDIMVSADKKCNMNSEFQKAVYNIRKLEERLATIKANLEEFKSSIGDAIDEAYLESMIYEKSKLKALVK